LTISIIEGILGCCFEAIKPQQRTPGAKMCPKVHIENVEYRTKHGSQGQKVEWLLVQLKRDRITDQFDLPIETEKGDTGKIDIKMDREKAIASARKLGDGAWTVGLSSIDIYETIWEALRFLYVEKEGRRFLASCTGAVEIESFLFGPPSKG